MFRALAPLLLAAPLAAQALCSSDDVAPVSTLVERFTRADCLACWRAPAAPPRAAEGALVLDWIVPGPDRPASPLAPSDDALQRLQSLHRRAPARMETVASRRDGPPVHLRIAHGEAFNDYVGVSIELADAGREPWDAWLLLVETVPAGAGGSPSARSVVRKVFRPEAWSRARRAAGPLAEARSMQVPLSIPAERVRLVALVQDGRGRVRAIAQSACRE